MMLYMRTIGASLALAIVSLSATADERPLTDYATLLEITRLDKVYAMPAAQRDRLLIQGNLKPRNPAFRPEQVRLTVVDGEQRTVLPVAADGSFELRADPRWVQHNPAILTSLPDGEKSAFSFSVRPLLPEGLRYNYRALMASVTQMNAMMKASAGAMRFFMPTFSGIELRFAAGAAPTVTLQTASGTRVLPADAQSRVRLELDQALISSDAELIVSARPQAVDFIEN